MKYLTPQEGQATWRGRFAKVGKAFIAVSISVTLLFTGTEALFPHKVEAAYSVSKANAIVADGKYYLGRPYKFGASTSTTRYFDCSSFTKRVYSMNGITLPRTSKAQAQKGYKVSRSNLKKGDLVFFDTTSKRSGIDHVAIYAGNGKLLHTYKVGVGVTYSNINSSYWSGKYVTARRVM